MKFWITFLILLPSTITQAKEGGDGVGNGGDAVLCISNPNNTLNGWYSLDYLTQLSPNDSFPIVHNLSESLLRIEKLIKLKTPSLAPALHDFLSSLFNETNYRLPRIWQPTAMDLIDLKDEALLVNLPSNCKTKGRVSIAQAVIRVNPLKDPLPGDKIVYRYVQNIINNLNSNNPLQLSFLIIHEWLWDISKNVEANRRINHLLHSTQFDAFSRAEVKLQLESLGVNLGDNENTDPVEPIKPGPPIRVALLTTIRLLDEALKYRLRDKPNVKITRTFRSIEDFSMALNSGDQFDVVLVDEFVANPYSSEAQPEGIWKIVDDTPNIKFAILGFPEDRYKFPICLNPSNVSFLSRELSSTGNLSSILESLGSGEKPCINL